jgi:toxin-antitoxin system PIN domain toxin
MTSFDTNIVFPALASDVEGHTAARAFMNRYGSDARVVLCELMLLEVYTLLRNPKVGRRPLSAPRAVTAIQALRAHPVWRVVDYDAAIAEPLWALAGSEDFPYPRSYDARLALTLRHHGVTEFATRNVKDFQGFGFARVWDPLAA